MEEKHNNLTSDLHRKICYTEEMTTISELLFLLNATEASQNLHLFGFLTVVTCLLTFADLAKAKEEVLISR